MRMAVRRLALGAALPAALLATACTATTVASNATMAPAGDPASKTWSCVATDDGSQNPGQACPREANTGYKYPGITNSDGWTTFVNNDMWNPPGKGHPQTIYVNSPGDWAVASNQPTGNTAVLAYPSVQQLFTRSSGAPAPISGFADLYSDFTESMPSGGDNEAGFDIWLGTSVKTAYSQEVMIWVDNHRTNPPPGRIVGHPAFDGVPYTVWDDSGTIYVVRNHNAPSSRVSLITVLNWLLQTGLSPAGSGINDIEFGWEICSTNNEQWIFTMSSYDLVSRCKGGGSSCWQG